MASVDLGLGSSDLAAENEALLEFLYVAPVGLMEIAPDLQFMHYTVAEAQLPTDALVNLPDDLSRDTVAICCDLERHVFNPEHTDGRVAAALRE